MSEPASDKPQNLARFVATDVSDARLGRLWSGIAPRLPGPGASGAGRRVRILGSALALAAAGALGVFAYHARGTGSSPLDGASLETRADTLSIRLVDGSSLRLDASTQARVEHDASTAVKVVLERGRLECDVAHQEGRSFVVLAGGVEVRVVGTRFSVSLDPQPDARRVEVSVQRGVVEVRNETGALSRVEAGHSFSQITSLNPSSAPSASSPGAGTSPPQTPSAVEAGPVPEPEASAAPSAEHAREHALGAKELLERAGELRRDGRVREAADQYELLLGRFPNDARAGLAAFELGRLRMDRLGDLSGAIRALELAARAAPGAGFREDALGRLASAYAARGDLAACAKLRDRYVREYPSGIHRAALEQRCGTKE